MAPRGPDLPESEEEWQNDDPNALSRSDQKRARRVEEDALVRLARELMDLSERRLEQLELPESVLDAVTDARAISSAPAKNRQVRLIRTKLREVDWTRIRLRLVAFNQHGTVPPAASDQDLPPERDAGRWVVRLVGEGTIALEALLRECPTADRTRLRQLVRSVNKATAERRYRAEQKLIETVQSLLATADHDAKKA